MTTWMIYRDDDPLTMTALSDADLDTLLASLRRHFPAHIWDAETVEADENGEPLGDGA